MSMNPKPLLTELHRRNPVLSITGWIHLILLAGALLGMLIDTRTILGINPWVKPAKFMISITIFVWTMGWLLDWAQRRYPRSVSAITWAVAILLLFVFWPLCWIPFVTDCMKRTEHYCRNCH